MFINFLQVGVVSDYDLLALDSISGNKNFSSQSLMAVCPLSYVI